MEGEADVVGDSAGAESSELDAANADRAIGQQFTGPMRLLRDLEAGLAEVDDGDADIDDVVEARRATIPEPRLADDEGDPRVRAQRLLAEAEAAQPFGAGALEELQVVGVEDDAGGVGVFPVDAHRLAEVDGRFPLHRDDSQRTPAPSSPSGLQLLVDGAPDRVAGLGLVEGEGQE